MLLNSKVLAVTKRISDLEEAQALLYAAGLKMITATNLASARSIVDGIGVQGVIVCRHSWSERERQSLISYLTAKRPRVAVIVHCPGFRGCKSPDCNSGALCNSLPVSSLIHALEVSEERVM